MLLNVEQGHCISIWTALLFCILPLFPCPRSAFHCLQCVELQCEDVECSPVLHVAVLVLQALKAYTLIYKVEDLALSLCQMKPKQPAGNLPAKSRRAGNPGAGKLLLHSAKVEVHVIRGI